MADKKRYIITGASGHIGNNLVRYINKTEPESEIVVLTRRKITRELNSTNCIQVKGSLDDKNFLKENIKKGDIIVHLAAFIDLTDKQKETTFRVNFDYTKTLCDFAKMNRNRFIYVGSVDGIYKDKSIDIIEEPTEYYPEKVEGNYGKSKALAAQYVLDCMNGDNEFSAAIVLPSAVMGINDYKPSAVGKIILDCVNKRAEFGIRGGYNFVDVNDVVFVIFSLMKNDNKGQYIVSGESVTVKEMYKKINSALGVKKRPVMIPLFLVKTLLPFVKMLNKITLKSLTESHNYSCEKAKKELMFSPTDIDKTINDTVNWFIANKNLFNRSK